MSDNTKQKKLIRARQQSTGETYSTARLHVLGSRPAEAEPPSGLRASVEATMRLAGAAAAGDEPAGQALRAHLAALDPGDLRKIEVLMYAGPNEGGVRELAESLSRDTHENTVDVVAEKTLMLVEYLTDGLRVAKAEGIDLDGVWLHEPSSKWARAPGSDYDRAIDGMRAWDARQFTAGDHDPHRLRRAWAQREGVTAADHHFCLTRLTAEGCRRAGDTCHHLRGADHTSLWMKDGKPHIYVTQPYDLSLKRLDEMFRVCRRLGLTLRVDSAIAWHAPGAVLVEVLRA